MLIGFSPRKAEFSLYVSAPGNENKTLLEKLGKYKMGKSCIYFKKLADLDLGTLEKLSKETIRYIMENQECCLLYTSILEAITILAIEYEKKHHAIPKPCLLYTSRCV